MQFLALATGFSTTLTQEEIICMFTTEQVPLLFNSAWNSTSLIKFI